MEDLFFHGLFRKHGFEPTNGLGRYTISVVLLDQLGQLSVCSALVLYMIVLKSMPKFKLLCVILKIIRIYIKLDSYIFVIQNTDIG